MERSVNYEQREPRRTAIAMRPADSPATDAAVNLLGRPSRPALRSCLSRYLLTALLLAGVALGLAPSAHAGGATSSGDDDTGAGSATTPATTVPSVPAGFTISGVHHAASYDVVLSWHDPGDPSIDYYEIMTDCQWDCVFERLPSTTATTTSHTVTGHTYGEGVYGTTYHFMIRAVNEAGPGAPTALLTYSANAPPTPAPAQTPAAPGGFTIAGVHHPGSYDVVLTWDDPGDASIEYYEVQHYGIVGQVRQFARVAASSAITTGHTVAGIGYPDPPQAFRVRAVNEHGAGPPSAYIIYSAAAPPSPPLQDVTGLSASADGNQQTITLTWDTIGDPWVAYLEYRYRLPDGDEGWRNWLAMPWGALTSFTKDMSIHLDRHGHGPWRFQVRPVSHSGRVGPESEAASVTVPPHTAALPEKPTGFTYEVDGRNITWSWDNPNNPDITGYDVYDFHRNRWREMIGSSASTTSFATSNAYPGYVVQKKVRARTAAGAGPESDTLSVTIPGAPQEVVATPGDGEVLIEWAAPSAAGTLVLTGYEYRVREQDTGTVVHGWTHVDPDARSVRITDLVNGTLYGFDLRARNASAAGLVTSAGATPASELALTTACPSDVPADAIWSACMTLGSSEAFAGYLNTWFAEVGELSDATFTLDGTRYTIEAIYQTLWSGTPEFVVGFDDQTWPMAGDWILQVGGRSVALKDAGRREFTYAWDDPGFGWTAADAGDGIRVSLRVAGGPLTTNMAGSVPEEDTGRLAGDGCRVDVAVAFADADGNAIAMDALSASEFTVEEGRVGTPVADDDGLGWAVPAWSTAGFAGLLRVRMPETERWRAGEQAFRVSGDDGCVPLARNELASLALDGLDLDPAFAADTTSYAVEADAETEQATVRAAAVYGTAQVSIAPDDADADAAGHQVALAEGETEVTVTVTPGDGSTAQTWTVTVTRAFDPGVLTSFVLVDASNDADLGAVTSGGTVSVSADGSYGIRAEVEAGADVGSVVLSLRGPGTDDTHTQTENVTPYSLWGDASGGANGRAEHGRALAAGSYTLTATAYAESGGTGEELDSLTVPFTVEVAAAPAPSSGVLTSFVLVDASNDADLGAVANGGTVSVSADGSYGIRAEVEAGADVGSVVLSLRGPGTDDTHTQTENVTPYSLWGDASGGANGRAEHGRALAAGSYTLTATAYAESGGTGEELDSLTAAFTVEVAASAALTVADARAEEGTDATLDFAVTLVPTRTVPVTVAYATSDGTATAGEDYTAAAGTLTFAVGETAKTVSVAVLDDARDEGEETMTLTLANARGATIDNGTATGTIENADPLPRAWLARFGRTAAGHVLDAVAGRLDGAPAAAAAAVAGHRLEAAAAAHAAQASASGWSEALAPGAGQERATSMRFADLLAGSSFDVTAGRLGGAGRWGVWGRGAWSQFAGGSDGELKKLDGGVLTATVGADYEQGRTLAGLALAYSTGSGSYEHASADSGELRSTLLSVHPYLRLTLHERLAVWGLMGYGLVGDLELEPEGAAHALATDSGLLMGAFGARGTLLAAQPGGGFELIARADALLLRMSSDAIAGLAAARAEVTRSRVLFEAAWRNAPVLGGLLTPALEIGGRYDGGDAERGAGLVAGGSLDYRLPEWGLTLSASGRGLLVHENDGFREWSAGAALSLDPGAPGRGLALRVAPSWGRTATGAEQLWSLRNASSLAAGAAPEPVPARVSAELSYGLETPGAGGVLTPYAGLELTHGFERTTRAGTRLSVGPGLTVTLEGSRTEAAEQYAATAYRLLLRGAVHY